MIATVGGITTMWITAGTFGASILITAALRLEGAGQPCRTTRRQGLAVGISEGLRFVWNLRVLRALALIDLVVTSLYLPIESVLFPKYFTDRHQPAQLCWVLMSLAAGSLAGAVGYAVLSKRMGRRRTLLVATLTLGVAMAAISLLPPLPVIMLLCAVIGLVYGPMRPIYNYVMQTRSPRHLRGRVIGVMTSLPYAAGPLGFVLAGPLTDAAGLTTTFLTLALPITLTGLLACALPSLRELDHASSAATRLSPPAVADARAAA